MLSGLVIKFLMAINYVYTQVFQSCLDEQCEKNRMYLG